MQNIKIMKQGICYQTQNRHLTIDIACRVNFNITFEHTIYM